MELGISETFMQICKQGPSPAFGIGCLRECYSIRAREGKDAGAWVALS